MAASTDYEQFEYLRSEHSEEMEVLQSIYDGDDNFKALNGSTIQYKIGEDEEPLSILVEIKWTMEYPEAIPAIHLDSFYNQHLSVVAKREAMQGITEEAWKNAGDQQTYTLIEWMKEHVLQLIGQYVFDDVCRLENRENEPEPEAPKQETRKEQMTKAQKRREWNKLDRDGKLLRGHDWVDVVRHLSQTGGSSSGAGITEAPSDAPKS
ncbi:RWD domain-containing protein 4 [Orchesella cincta]|uniref:RWD domain-containing protein 4 n=1 Tax=Orchesella cincta TaxID=48709 RepID=A0A1D2MRA2_ORCCI|nr:RWD domain-containing protein 4 [Orchesella cincta]